MIDRIHKWLLEQKLRCSLTTYSDHSKIAKFRIDPSGEPIMATSTAVGPKTTTPSPTEKIKNSDNPAMQRLASNVESQSKSTPQAYSRQHHRHNRS